jgi:hypothetical protein
MTIKADYAPEEWEIISDGFIIVGLGMAQADTSGLVGNLKEWGAFVKKAMDTSTPEFLLNDLIQSVLDNKKLDRDADSGRNYDMDVVVEHCALIADILDARTTPEEATVFKRWLLEIAQGVANASSEGHSRTGQNISEAESAALAQIRAALRL